MAVVGPEVLCGRYELRGVIGRGGMGEVCDGWDSRLERPVAVKLLHSSFASAPHLVERFHLEARAAAGLSHPNVVSVYDFGEHRGLPFIVMERLPGHTLADQVARGPLPQQHVRRVLDRVLAALEAAHARQILHRDIKPGNILVTEGGDVKVADFGLAKTPHTTYTQTGQIMGTMAYISPERLAGAPASVADDLYATAVLGYECLAGRRPFAGDDNLAVLAQAILNDRPPPLYAMRADVEPQLAAVIERALAREPHSRFATATQMRSALQVPPPISTRPATKVLAAPPFTAMPGSLAMMPAPTRATGGRTGKLLIALAALVVLAVVAVAFASDPPTSGSPQPVGTSATDSTTSAPATPVIQPPPQPAPEAGPGEGPPNGKGGGPRKGSKRHGG
jgi:serine/threonine protein kinase